jgi:hypothetical protein
MEALFIWVLAIHLQNTSSYPMEIMHQIDRSYAFRLLTSTNLLGVIEPQPLLQDIPAALCTGVLLDSGSFLLLPVLCFELHAI